MPEVHDNAERHRYELAVDGGRAIAAYERIGDVLVFTHTEVPPELEGHGIGSALVAGALADARARGLQIVPQCPFVAAYVERHSEWQDLLAD